MIYMHTASPPSLTVLCMYVSAIRLFSSLDYQCTQTPTHTYIQTYIPTYTHTYITTGRQAKQQTNKHVKIHICIHPHTYTCIHIHLSSQIYIPSLHTRMHNPTLPCKSASAVKRIGPWLTHKEEWTLMRICDVTREGTSLKEGDGRVLYCW